MAEKRVLFWSGSFLPHLGGVEILGGHLLPRLRAQGYEFAIVTTRGEWDLPLEDDYAGIPVHRFPFWKALRARDPLQIIEIKKQVMALKRSFQPDLVHINSLGLTAFFHLQTLEAQPAPTLISVHQDLPEDVAQAGNAQGELLRRADWVTCVSDQAVARTRARMPGLADRISRIYNGLPDPELDPAPLDFERPALLCIGRLVVDKGFDIPLQALPTLLEHYPRLTLKIIGDGPEKPRLEKMAATLGLGEVVHFTSWIAPEAIPAAINKSTLVLVPSLNHQETFSLVALQAAEMGRPVIASRVGGLPEVVVDAETGLLVPPGDAAALAQAVLALMDEPDKTERIGNQARTRALVTFGLDRYIGAYAALYQKILSGGAHS